MVPTPLKLPAPKWTVELIAEHDKHTYKVTWGDGAPKLLPGVTGALGIIAKPALINWAKREALDCFERALLARMKGEKSALVAITPEVLAALRKEASKRPDKIKDDAADLGTLAHFWIDKFVRGESVVGAPASIMPALIAFIDWWESSGFKFLAGDTKVACLYCGFGGSLDALALAKDANGDYTKVVVLDWKTSKAIYEEMALQVAAYSHCVHEQFGLTVADAWIVRFSKTEPVKFEKKQLSNLDVSFQAFMNALALSKLMSEPHFVETQTPGGK